MIVARTFHFDASHYLPNYNGACERMHGHTYRLEIEVEDEIKKDGMVLDFKILKDHVQEKVLEKLDHNILNDIIENPTAENITEWIWKQLEDEIKIHKIRLWEGHGKWVELVKN